MRRIRRGRAPAPLRAVRTVGGCSASRSICAIAFAYVQPIRAYMDAKDDIEAHRAQRAALLRKQAALRHRLELVETDAFVEREARRIGLVRPGERLYIVKGVEKWKRAASGDESARP